MAASDGDAPTPTSVPADPTTARTTAALVDNVLLPFLTSGTVSLVLGGLTGALLAAGLAWALTVLPEARTGRTPAKALLELRTRQVDGSPLRLSTALLRRPWPLLAGAGIAVPVLLLPTAVLLVAVGVSVAVAPDGRGLHDRIAGTRVDREPIETRGRLTALLLFVVLLVATLVRLSTPGLVAT